MVKIHNRDGIISQNQGVSKPQDLFSSTIRGKDALNKEHIIPLTD